MNYFMSKEEQQRRKELAEHARVMLTQMLPVEDQDETSLTAPYQGYYMQVSISPLHPLLVISLAKAINHPGSAKKAAGQPIELDQRAWQPCDQSGCGVLCLPQHALAGH